MCLLYEFTMLKCKSENYAEVISMSKKIRTEAVDFLFDSILLLENREECYKFFEDICTINESDWFPSKIMSAIPDISISLCAHINTSAPSPTHLPAQQCIILPQARFVIISSMRQAMRNREELQNVYSFMRS